MERDVAIVVRYPAGEHEIVVRTELDWERDVRPARVEGDLAEFRLAVPAEKGGLYYKPVRRRADGALDWSTGGNYLVPAGRHAPCEIYPVFGSLRGSLGPRVAVLAANGVSHDVRVYLPPGYEENPLKRYPVLYANDGANLFLAEEGFNGANWGIGRTVDLLEQMAIIDKVVVVAIHAGPTREADYTLPGYTAYGTYLVDTLVPWVDANYRTLAMPLGRAVLGASLGGVVSFYLAWEFPQVFGQAGCLSSTFGFADDLVARVLAEPRRSSRFYLDSGWPNDNFDATLRMADALTARGWGGGPDLLFFAFPRENHSEKHWAARVHLPFQFFFGRARKHR